MKAPSLPHRTGRTGRPSWLVRGFVAALATVAGSTALEMQQRRWIFQVAPSTRSAEAPEVMGLHDRWIEFDSRETGTPVKLHGLWLPQANPQAPVLLYLHGVRWDVHCGTDRMQRLHELGFSVLSIDYRGFGRSTPGLPSERMACEDARAAWQWLALHHPQSPRYVYGHSLGGAVAVHLASEVSDIAGLIVEGTFTSLPEVVSTFKWGWLPVAPLITQRFDSAQRAASVTAPVLVVHGSDDRLIPHELGRALFERITAPKRFVLVEGGTHHDTDAVGQAQYREALRELFGLAA
jgi:pimeloyl-ACP methyl ester carboxylesterase